MKQTENSARSPWQPCNAVGWDHLQIKRRFDIELGKMLQNGPLYSLDTEVPYLKAQHVQWNGVRLEDLPTMWASPNDITALQVHFGDLLVCEGGEVGRGAIVQSEPPDDCIIQNALHRVRGRVAGDQRFLYYLLRHAATQNWFDVLCNRSTIAHFTGDKFGEMWVWLPPVNRQRAIAGFLDHETARIDALIAAKERVLGLLAEKKRALITHAVTRGLNHDVPFRDSGIPWLGEIPDHWRIIRLKHFAAIYYGLSQPPEYRSAGSAFIRATNVKRGELTAIGLVFVDEADLPFSRIVRLKTDDIIVVRSGAYTGDSAIVTEKWEGAIAGYDMVVRCYRLAVPTFVSFAMLCQYVLEAQIDPLRIRAAQPHLNAEELGDIVLALPPESEQQAIVAHIKQETKKLDAMRDATEKTIGLLKERRAALIAAAVMGEMNIAEQ
ncbi:MAG: restriction endonuclease subunit S [Pseudomonadota bacterium]